MTTALADYQEEIRLQGRAWDRKPCLRAVYRRWYARIVASLSPLDPTFEIGAGCGNFKAYYPRCIATDLWRNGPWIDATMDGENLSLPNGTIGNFVAIHSVHHMQRPMDFLRGASAALKPGGRIVILETAGTAMARMVYRLFSKEAYDASWRPTHNGEPLPANGHRLFANMAIPEVLFCRNRDDTIRDLPDLKLIETTRFVGPLYLLTGGYRHRGWLPSWGLSTALRIEDRLIRPFASFATMQILVVLEKLRTRSMT